MGQDGRRIQRGSSLRRRCNSRGAVRITQQCTLQGGALHTRLSLSKKRGDPVPPLGVGFPRFFYRIEVAFWHKHQLSDRREGCQLLDGPGPCAERARKNAPPPAVLIPRTLLLQTETSTFEFNFNIQQRTENAQNLRGTARNINLDISISATDRAS